MSLAKEVGAQLKELASRENRSARNLEMKDGLSQNSILRMFKGENTSLASIERLASVLGYDVQLIFLKDGEVAWSDEDEDSDDEDLSLPGDGV